MHPSAGSENDQLGNPNSSNGGEREAGKKRKSNTPLFNLTYDQKAALLQKREECKNMTQKELGEWAAAAFGLDCSVSQSTVSNIIKNSGKIMGVANTPLITPGANGRIGGNFGGNPGRVVRRKRRVSCEAVDDRLVAWVRGEIEEGRGVTGDVIIARAQELAAEHRSQFPGVTIPMPIFSNGWLASFKLRHGLICEPHHQVHNMQQQQGFGGAVPPSGIMGSNSSGSGSSSSGYGSAMGGRGGGGAGGGAGGVDSNGGSGGSRNDNGDGAERGGMANSGRHGGGAAAADNELYIVNDAHQLGHGTGGGDGRSAGSGDQGTYAHTIGPGSSSGDVAGDGGSGAHGATGSYGGVHDHYAGGDGALLHHQHHQQQMQQQQQEHNHGQGQGQGPEQAQGQGQGAAHGEQCQQQEGNDNAGVDGQGDTYDYRLGVMREARRIMVSVMLEQQQQLVDSDDGRGGDSLASSHAQVQHVQAQYLDMFEELEQRMGLLVGMGMGHTHGGHGGHGMEMGVRLGGVSSNDRHGDGGGGGDVSGNGSAGDGGSSAGGDAGHMSGDGQVPAGSADNAAGDIYMGGRMDHQQQGQQQQDMGQMQ